MTIALQVGRGPWACLGGSRVGRRGMLTSTPLEDLEPGTGFSRHRAAPSARAEPSGELPREFRCGHDRCDGGLGVSFKATVRCETISESEHLASRERW